MSILTCFCCGTEVTAPQFFNGKAYGWTCIKKVSDQKRVKSKLGFIKCKVLSCSNKNNLVIEVNGTKFDLYHPRYTVEAMVNFEGMVNPSNVERTVSLDSLSSDVEGIIDLDKVKLHYIPTFVTRLIERLTTC